MVGCDVNASAHTERGFDCRAVVGFRNQTAALLGTVGSIVAGHCSQRSSA